MHAYMYGHCIRMQDVHSHMHRVVRRLWVYVSYRFGSIYQRLHTQTYHMLGERSKVARRHTHQAPMACAQDGEAVAKDGFFQVMIAVTSLL